MLCFNIFLKVFILQSCCKSESGNSTILHKIQKRIPYIFCTDKNWPAESIVLYILE